MKLKQRFKQALFGFFKDEILNSFKPSDSIPGFTGEVIKPTTIDVELRRIGCVIDFDSETNDYSLLQYEIACDKARKELFKEFIKYIQIEGTVLLDPRYYHKRAIVFDAWVGVTKK